MSRWDNSSNRTRGRKWMEIRSRVMRRDGYMCQCGKCKGKKLLADEVDHIVPLFKGGTDDLDNLMAMNKDCHEDKTNKDKGNRVKIATGLDGWPVTGRGG